MIFRTTWPRFMG